MAEITYQMVLNTLQTVGLLMGIYYYIMSLSYTRRNQEETLKTRKATLFHQTVGQTLTNDEPIKHVIRIEANPFSSHEEWLELIKDPDYALSSTYMRNFFENLGIYHKHGLIDLEMFADYQPHWGRMFWEMSKESIYEIRKRRGPGFYQNFEYIIDAFEQYWKEHPEKAP